MNVNENDLYRPDPEVVNVVCVYRRGGDYDADAAQYLLSLLEGVDQCFDFTCPTRLLVLTDDERCADIVREAGRGANVQPVVLPLVTGLPGWWSLLEAYRVIGPCLLVGLDTVLIGDCSPLAREASTMPADRVRMLWAFRYANRAVTKWTDGSSPWASGVMAWNGDHTDCLRSFDYDRHLPLFPKGEQYWVAKRFKQRGVDIKPTQDVLPGIYSYKWHVAVRPDAAPPPDAAIVVFHGKPRPHEVVDVHPWLSELWVTDDQVEEVLM